MSSSSSSLLSSSAAEEQEQEAIHCQTYPIYSVYILAYKSKNFGPILALKATGLTRMRGKLGNNICRRRHGALSM